MDGSGAGRGVMLLSRRPAFVDMNGEVIDMCAGCADAAGVIMGTKLAGESNMKRVRAGRELAVAGRWKTGVLIAYLSVVVDRASKAPIQEHGGLACLIFHDMQQQSISEFKTHLGEVSSPGLSVGFHSSFTLQASLGNLSCLSIQLFRVFLSSIITLN